jgi:hypothetical protein
MTLSSVGYLERYLTIAEGAIEEMRRRYSFEKGVVRSREEGRISTDDGWIRRLFTGWANCRRVKGLRARSLRNF